MQKLQRNAHKWSINKCTQAIPSLRSREWRHFAHYTAGCLMRLSQIIFIRNSYQKGFSSLLMPPFKSHQTWKHISLAHICSFYRGCGTYYLQELSKCHCYRFETLIRQKTELKRFKLLCTPCDVWSMERYHFPTTHTQTDNCSI